MALYLFFVCVTLYMIVLGLLYVIVCSFVVLFFLLAWNNCLCCQIYALVLFHCFIISTLIKIVIKHIIENKVLQVGAATTANDPSFRTRSLGTLAHYLFAQITILILRIGEVKVDSSSTNR